MRRPYSETMMPKIGDRVECLSHWGFVRGVVTALYDAYNFVDDEGETIHAEAHATIRCDSVPKPWPYSTYEFAPEVDTIYPETK